MSGSYQLNCTLNERLGETLRQLKVDTGLSITEITRRSLEFVFTPQGFNLAFPQYSGQVKVGN